MSGAHQASQIVFWIAKALEAIRTSQKLFSLGPQGKTTICLSLCYWLAQTTGQCSYCVTVFEYGVWLPGTGLLLCSVLLAHDSSWSVFPRLVTTSSFCPTFSSLLRCFSLFSSVVSAQPITGAQQLRLCQRHQVTPCPQPGTRSRALYCCSVP